MGMNLIKVQDWTQFDNLLEQLADEGSKSEKPLPADLKEAIYGDQVMTDKQHKYIVALLSIELEWEPETSFNFILKNTPGLKDRLKKRIKEEHDLTGLYQQVKKKEASKLINILKFMVGRKK